MAKIVITASTNCIKFEFNDVKTRIGLLKSIWNKSDLHFELPDGEKYVQVFAFNKPLYDLGFDDSGGLEVDTVAGAEPTSNSDLYDKLIALKG